MKNMKRLLAVVLALVMCASMLSGLSFGEQPVQNRRTEIAQTAQADEPHGFQSLRFRTGNSYRYAADEIVRAIVLLQGAAPAELPEEQRATAATRVAAQHNTLRNALRKSGVRYAEEFVYDTLLNGLAISVAYGDLEKIAEISSVKAVYIANHYAAPVVQPGKRMESSNEMTGASLLQTKGYRGEGMLIAVLDTGITAQHAAFQVYGEKLKDAALSEDDAKAFIEEKGYGSYLNQKVPFAYDYYDKDDDATDNASGHGSHVAGIAAGYAETDEGAITFCGTAPFAQIAAMKIFGDEGGTSSDYYFAALEDAYELGADVVNMSIGAQNGNTYDEELENEVFGNVYQTLEKNGVICCVAAGNEYSMAQSSSGWAGGGFVTSDYSDYGVVASPSTYDGNLSVAAAENAVFPGYVLTAGEREIPYYDSSENAQFLTAMGGIEDLEYVVIPNAGEAADYRGVDVNGKIALVSRGVITFQEKVNYAAEAGAKAILVYNNADGVIYMSIDTYAVPAASISKEDGAYLIEQAKLPEATASAAATRAAEQTKITDAAELADGAYLIVNEQTGRVFNGPAGNQKGNYIELDTATDDEIEAAALTLDAATGSLKTSAGKYLSGEADKNSIVLSDTPVANEIAFEDGNVIITNNSTQFAYNADWAGFRFYKLTSNVLADSRSIVSLYRVGEAAPAEPVILPVGKVSFPDEQRMLDNPNGWLMSEFSSWGPTPSLTLKPELTGIGGNVYSVAAGTEDGYALMSGTSMATPNVTGLMALVSQYIDKNLSADASASDKENPFTDVAAEQYYYDPVLWAVEKEITNGTSADEFSPNATCTRGQVVTFLWRASGSPKPTGTENRFTDVAAGQYYYDAVLWAVEKEITNGTSADKFSPNATCTRGQVVTFLWRSAGSPAPVNGQNPFADVVKDAYYETAVLWAVEQGITNGTSADKFSPNATCTRGQVVTFLYRALVSEELTKPERALLADKLVKSTAQVLDDADGYPYSPRKQGAGLASMEQLTAASAYITEPICNLGDNADGAFEIRFTLKDIKGESTTYELTPMVMADYAEQADLNGDGTKETYNTLSAILLGTEPYTLEGETFPADVDCTAPETVTVPAGGSVDVSVKLKLTDDTKAYLDEMFPNGTYIEGYIFLTATEDGQPSEALHATYLGFYGDWAKAPMLEQHDWREVMDIYEWLSLTPIGTDGNPYDGETNELWLNEDGEPYTLADAYGYLDFADTFQVTTDVNTALAINGSYLAMGRLYGGYAGLNLFNGEFYKYLGYNQDRVAIAPGTGFTDMLLMWPYGLRNARHLIMVASDAETGEVYEATDYSYMPKALYDEDYSEWVSYAMYTEENGYAFHGTDAEGNILPNNTKVNIAFYANPQYGEDAIGKLLGENEDYSKLLKEGEEFLEWQFNCDIDTEAPQLVGEPVIDKDAGTVTITVKDNRYLAAIYLTDEDDNDLDARYFAEDEAGAEVTVTFEYPEDAVLLRVYLEDYASNEAAQDVFIEEPTFVKLRFSHPEGTELSNYTDEYTAYVGQNLTLPAVEGETKTGEFVAWTTEAVPEKTDADTFFDEYYTDDGIYFDGDKLTVTAEMDGMTLYALYEIDEIAALTEVAQQVLTTPESWEGQWILDGYDWNVDEDDETSPVDYFLTAQLDTKAADDETYVEYYIDWNLYAIYGRAVGADEDMVFTFAAAEGGYTIRTAAGKYLTVKDGALALADAVDENSVWTVTLDEEMCVTLQNGTRALTFDEDAHSFVLADTTEGYTTPEPYNLQLYGQTVQDFYTTNPNR